MPNMLICMTMRGLMMQNGIFITRNQAIRVSLLLYMIAQGMPQQHGNRQMEKSELRSQEFRSSHLLCQSAGTGSIIADVKLNPQHYLEMPCRLSSQPLVMISAYQYTVAVHCSGSTMARCRSC